MIQADKSTRSGKSVNKVSEKCSLITKLTTWPNNLESNKLLQSFISQNLWLKSKCKKLFLLQKIHSETFTIKFHHWFKISQYLWQTILRCKNWLQFLSWKVNSLLFFSMKIKSLFHTECFQMKKSTKKTSYFSEWKTLNLEFCKNFK